MNSSHSDLELRRATPQDAQTVAEITDAAYEKYVALLGRKPQPMTADYSEIIAQHPVWLLVQADQHNHPIAVLVLILEEEAMMIYSIAVRPEVQQMGLGRLLLRFAEQQTLEAGFQMLRLYTNELMPGNVDYYQRFGYRETGREPFKGSTTVYMAKLVTD